MKNFTKLAAIALLVAGSIACDGERKEEPVAATTTEATATVAPAVEPDTAVTATTATTATETSATTATTTDATATSTDATTPPPAPQQ